MRLTQRILRMMECSFRVDDGTWSMKSLAEAFSHFRVLNRLLECENIPCTLEPPVVQELMATVTILQELVARNEVNWIMENVYSNKNDSFGKAIEPKIVTDFFEYIMRRKHLDYGKRRKYPQGKVFEFEFESRHHIGCFRGIWSASNALKPQATWRSHNLVKYPAN